jgi:hypothetical protein
MSAAPAPHELVTDLPAGQPHAQAHARTRGEARPRSAAAATAVPKILAGSSPLFTQPPSLAALWDLHVRSARWFEFGPWRALRYGWGMLHIVIAGTGYLVAWSTRSFPAGVLLAGLIIAAVILL